MDTEQKQKLVAKLFNLKLPAHIITYSDSWINGYIQSFDGMDLTIIDRKDGLVTLSITNISLVEEFVGDYSTLKKVEE